MDAAAEKVRFRWCCRTRIAHLFLSDPMQNHVDLLPPPHKEQKHDSANSEKQRTLHSLVIEIELEIHSNAPKQQPESCLEQRGEFPVN